MHRRIFFGLADGQVIHLNRTPKKERKREKKEMVPFSHQSCMSIVVVGAAHGIKIIADERRHTPYHHFLLKSQLILVELYHWSNSFKEFTWYYVEVCIGRRELRHLRHFRHRSRSQRPDSARGLGSFSSTRFPRPWTWSFSSVHLCELKLRNQKLKNNSWNHDW